LQLRGTCSQIAEIKGRPRLLKTCFDFDALVFAESVDPSDVEALTKCIDHVVAAL